MLEMTRMSDLTNLEKRTFEQFLGMGSGYVLDFSNRSFAEFVRDSSSCDIFDSRYNYESGSKANRLRAFWQKEPNSVVGKLMSELIEYGGGREDLKGPCQQIVARLLGGSKPHAQTASQSSEQVAQRQRITQDLDRLKQEYLKLSVDSDRSKAGFALERLLNRLFEIFQLEPRQPFRVIGEQIDGSFELDAQIYLLESKWEKHPLPEEHLLVFRGKIEGKSTFTRGVFIALNGISAPARDAITRGKAPSFFVMDGYDLMMILSEAISLTSFLRKRVRLLAEQGRVCVPFSELS
jgi:hypothetical protein